MRQALAVDIRPALRDDAAVISGLIRDLARRFITNEFSPEGENNFLSSAEPAAISRYMDEGFAYFVAEEQGKIQGVVGIRDETHLFHLFVAEPHQGTGLGRSLWRIAQEATAPPNYSGEFTVNSSENAVGFYERLGFVKLGEVDERGGVVSIPMRLAAPAV